MRILENQIGAQFLPPSSGQYLDKHNPANGALIARIPLSDSAEVEAAVQAAKQAFPAWRDTPIPERARILNRIAALIEANLDRLALAESEDSGKPLALARAMDIPRAAHNFSFFAAAIQNWGSESHFDAQTGLNITLRQPIGVVGCISPWNLPLYLFTWKIAPALAAGNCVIAKPSEVTPTTAYLLAQLAHEAGLPAGVLNILHGLGGSVGAAIVAHPQIKAISFTGGTATGKQLAATAAPMFKKLSLELGGKNPVLIFDDCDYAQMLATTVRSAFTNQGQICLCGSRVYVQRGIYERFRADFVAAVAKLVVGNPLDAATNVGAVVSKPHFDKILSYIELAKSEGGQILVGGEAVAVEGCPDGLFIRPTVIEGLANHCRTNQEEIFGPVVTIQPFDTESEALGLANDSGYGLASVVWTENLRRAHRVAEQLEAGIVWVNCWLVRDLRTPFGGVKQSGVGREGGVEALRFFTEAKNVCIKY